MLSFRPEKVDSRTPSTMKVMPVIVPEWGTPLASKAPKPVPVMVQESPTPRSNSSLLLVCVEGSTKNSPPSCWAAVAGLIDNTFAPATGPPTTATM